MQWVSKNPQGSLRVDGHRLAQLWQSATWLVEAEKPPPLEVGVDLADRLRGALGRALEARGDGGDVAATALHEAAFTGREPVTGAFARPFVLGVDSRGARLLIRLTLFGGCRAFAVAASAGLNDALARGLAVRSGHRHRVALASIAHRQIWLNDVRVPAFGEEAVLDFQTPLVLRRRERLAGRALGVLDSLVRRLTAVAQMMGLELAIGPAAWREWMRALAVDDTALEPVRWDRFSARDARARQPAFGYRGQLRIGGDLTELAPLLTLGQLVHAGGRAAMGYGRYRIWGTPDPLFERTADDDVARPPEHGEALIGPGVARVVTSPGTIAYEL